VIAYFDTSALLELVIAEDGADQAELLWQAAGEVVVSCLVWPEAVATLAPARRGRRLTDEGHRTASGALRSCIDRCTTVSVADRLVDRAADLAPDLHLRAADASNALTALGSEPSSSAKAGIGSLAVRPNLRRSPCPAPTQTAGKAEPPLLRTY
jgi:predicted nucleic acid-binding protein